jgi:hypothetical protein
VIRVDGNKAVKSATIDPNHVIPLVNRTSTSFTVK